MKQNRSEAINNVPVADDWSEKEIEKLKPRSIHFKMVTAGKKAEGPGEGKLAAECNEGTTSIDNSNSAKSSQTPIAKKKNADDISTAKIPPTSSKLQSDSTVVANDSSDEPNIDDREAIVVDALAVAPTASELTMASSEVSIDTEH